MYVQEFKLTEKGLSLDYYVDGTRKHVSEDAEGACKLLLEAGIIDDFNQFDEMEVTYLERKLYSDGRGGYLSGGEEEQSVPFRKFVRDYEFTDENQEKIAEACERLTTLTLKEI